MTFFWFGTFFAQSFCCMPSLLAYTPYQHLPLFPTQTLLHLMHNFFLHTFTHSTFMHLLPTLLFFPNVLMLSIPHTWSFILHTIAYPHVLVFFLRRLDELACTRVCLIYMHDFFFVPFVALHPHASFICNCNVPTTSRNNHALLLVSCHLPCIKMLFPRVAHVPHWWISPCKKNRIKNQYKEKMGVDYLGWHFLSKIWAKLKHTLYVPLQSSKRFFCKGLTLFLVFAQVTYVF